VTKADRIIVALWTLAVLALTVAAVVGLLRPDPTVGISRFPEGVYVHCPTILEGL
jgi:hypothetical protein